MASKRYKSVLIISDTHFPYHHADTLDFLKAIKSLYKPERVVHIGDEADYHCLSFHRTDGDLPGPLLELQLAQESVKKLGKIFPKVDLVDSNHGSMVYRRAKDSSMPKQLFKDYREILQSPKGWSWHFDLTLKMSDGRDVYFAHGKTSAPGKLSQTMSMNCIQGHYHERFEVIYWANPNGLFWDMRVGCLIDDKSLAFAYNNTNVKRPIIGTGVIVEGQPKLIPMVLDKHGRWIGKLV